MDYKKKYEESLNRARKIYNETEFDYEKGMMEEIFPELQESNDFGIRKEITDFIKRKLESPCSPTPSEKILTNWIAWLEKQGEQNTAEWHREDEQNLNACLGYIPDELLRRWIKDVIHAKYEKQGEQSSPQINERAWLYLVADVLTWKDGIGQYLDNPGVQKLAKKLCNEYQQKLYNPIPFGTDSEMVNRTITIPDGCVATIEDNKIHIKREGKSALEAINEKNVDNANKVEPKFKIGDWIVEPREGEPDGLWHIDRIEDGYYWSDKCGCTIEYADKNFHLWTIKDAKAGDVLANDHNILILKESVYDWYTNGNPYSVKAYCGIKPNGNFEIGLDNWSFCGTLHIHPATKEQCDILFTKMKEKGYEWDAERKELKKIEDEPENYKQQLMSEMADLVIDYIKQKE